MSRLPVTTLTAEQIERGEFFKYKGKDYWDDPYNFIKVDYLPVLDTIRGVEIQVITDILKPCFKEATGILTVGNLLSERPKKALLAAFAHLIYSSPPSSEYGVIQQPLYVTSKDDLISSLRDYSRSSLDRWERDASSTPRVNSLFPGEDVKRAIKVEWSNNRYFPSHSSASIPLTKWTKKHYYSFKMDQGEFNFFRKTKKDGDSVHFGLELEVCTAVPFAELQKIVTDVEPKQKPFFIFKDDSSITGRYNNKVEIVTVPMTPRKMKQEFKAFFEKLTKLGGGALGSYIEMSETTNNGLHIHVSKTSFDSKLHQKKFQIVFNSTTPSEETILQKVSDRPMLFHSNGYCGVSSEYKTKKVSRKLNNRLLDSTGRTSVCHSQNPQTVEVRLFQSIPKYNNIEKDIDFVRAVLDYTSGVSFGVLKGGWAHDFKMWLSKKPGYLSLKKELL